MLVSLRWRARTAPHSLWLSTAGCFLVGAALILGLSESRDTVATRVPTATAVESAGAVEVPPHRPRVDASLDERRNPRTGSPAAVSDDTDARRDDILALASDGSESAAAALAAMALSDADPAVREDAIMALGEIGGEIGLQTLAQTLNDADGDVQKAAVEALVDIGGEESARALLPVLSARAISLRAEAVDALADIGGDTAVELLRLAAKDENRAVREAAEEYLVELRH